MDDYYHFKQYDYEKSLELYKFEKRKSMSQSLFYIKDSDKVPSKKLIRLFLFILPFAFILSYFSIPRERLTLYQLELGQISNENIKSPFDVEIEDRLTTERKVLEKAKTIPPVFDYDPNVAGKKSQFIMSLSSFIEEFISLNLNERGELSTQDMQELIDLIKLDYDLDFTQRDIRNFILLIKQDKFNMVLDFLKHEIINFIYERKIIRDRSELNKYSQTGIRLINISTREAIHIIMLGDILDVDNAMESIKTKVDIFLINSGLQIRALLNKVINKVLGPNITFNRQGTEDYKNEVISSIPKVFFSKKRGERIISEGERVNESHILILDKINKRISEKRITHSHILYVFIYVMIIAVLFFFLLLLFHPWHALSSYYNYFMILSLFLLNIFIINAFWRFYQLLASAFEKEPVNIAENYIYALPFAFGVLLLSSLLNSKTAFTYGMFQLMFYTFIWDLDKLYLIYAFIGIVAATIPKNIMRKKNFYIKSVLLIILLQLASALLNSLLLEQFNLPDVLLRISLVFVSGFSVCVLLNTLIPFFEWIFKLSSDMKLLELLDFKHPLLEKLMFTASGTLHHSIAVANLSEIAARNVGCNPVLCRVASYYHDIGKITKPEYFIENITGKENKHNRLKPSMSSLILISHVKSGYELGKKYRLPAPILEVIQQHHGNALIKYFYNKALKKCENNKNDHISKDNFRYPGPKPFTKEAAIILLADRIEATSRVLTNPSASKIRSMVENTVKSSLLDGDLDNADLSLSEITKIIDSFCKVLYGAFHKRIDYPNQPGSYKA